MLTTSRFIYHNILRRTALSLLFIAGISNPAVAQRPPAVTSQRPVESTARVPTASSTVKAKYEGGVLGYPQKREGTLNFDDANERLVFRDKQGAELFAIPYEAINAAYADTQSRRPTGAVIAANSVPYGLGLPALFIKNKYRYLALHYRDTEARIVGTTSFKIDNKALLESTLNTLGTKANMTRRGEIFIRPRTTNGEDSDTMRTTLPPPM